MHPTGGGRHCAQCDRTVLDLTCLSETERNLALQRAAHDVRTGARVCLRAVTARNGYLINASRRVLTGGMAAMLAMAISGCKGDEHLATTTESPISSSHRAEPLLTSNDTDYEIPEEVIPTELHSMGEIAADETPVDQEPVINPEAALLWLPATQHVAN